MSNIPQLPQHRYLLRCQINLPCIITPLSPLSSPQPPPPQPSQQPPTSPPPTHLPPHPPSMGTTSNSSGPHPRQPPSPSPIPADSSHSPTSQRSPSPQSPPPAPTALKPAPGLWSHRLRPQKAVSSEDLAGPSRRPGTPLPPRVSDPEGREWMSGWRPLPSGTPLPPQTTRALKRKALLPSSMTSKRIGKKKTPGPTFLALLTSSRPLSRSPYPPPPFLSPPPPPSG